MPLAYSSVEDRSSWGLACNLKSREDLPTQRIDPDDHA